jgi:hypothetical protein
MRLSLFFSMTVLFIVSCNNDKGKTGINRSNTGYTLFADNGFKDSLNSSFANIYNASYLIHGDTGYVLCYFHDSIYFNHAPGKDSVHFPQLSMHLNKLQLQPFSVTINFFKVDFEGTGPGRFLFARNNLNENPDTPSISFNEEDSAVTIHSLKADSSGYYYLNVFGICRDSLISFKVKSIEISYD